MTTFILVHGAMHGSWCWEKIVPRLEAAGHRAIALDLPAMAPDDPTAPEDVTLALCADLVARRIDALDERVILVGHSMGGVTISETAELVPDRITALVYLTALLIPPGKATYDMTDERPIKVTATKVREDGKALVGIAETAPDVFYNLCDPEDTANAVRRLRPQPMSPGAEPLTGTPERFGRVPRVYIECLRDNALVLSFQRRMQQALPCDPVYSLDTDHSPFLSAPDALTEILVAIADQFHDRPLPR